MKAFIIVIVVATVLGGFVGGEIRRDAQGRRGAHAGQQDGKVVVQDSDAQLEIPDCSLAPNGAKLWLEHREGTGPGEGRPPGTPR